MLSSVSNPTVKSIAQLLAISTGLGIPVGAAAYIMRDQLSPEPDIPSATAFTDLPLIPEVGPEREEKTAGILSRLQQVIKGRMGNLTDAQSAGSLIGGATLGTGIGYGVAGRAMQANDKYGLDTQLRDKEEMFNQLLLQEQMASRGMKAAAVLDDAIETIFDHEFEKSAAAPGIGTAAAKAGESASELLKLEYLPALLAMVGGGYGLHKGYGNTVARDKNRAIADALRSSLDERLMGNPEGPKAPMIVKVRTNRIGSTPIAGGSGRSSGRDVLGRL